MRNYIPAKQQSQGFTLLELLLTITVLGILIGISSTAYSSNLRAERVKAAARETSAWLEEARRIAIQKAKPCRITIDRNLAQLAIDPGTGSTSSFCSSSEYVQLNLRSAVPNSADLLLCSSTLSGSDPASYALTCSGQQTGSNTLVFTPRGTADSTLLIKLHMTNAGSDRCIAVMAPLAQIRSGKASSSGCDFTTAF